VNKTDAWFDSGIHSIKSVRTRNGYSIKGSFNHPLLVLRKNSNGKPQTVWVPLESLKIGDYLIIKRNNELFQKNEVDLTHIEIISPNKRYKEGSFPKKLDENLATVLGCLIAEGNCADHKVGFLVGCSEYFEHFWHAWRLSLKDWSISESFRDSDECTNSEACGGNLVSFLEKIGLPPCKAENKVVPHTIFKSPKGIIAKFLSALFEGDGGPCLRKDNGCEIAYTSKSEQLITEIQILLLEFGIISSRYLDIKTALFQFSALRTNRSNFSFSCSLAIRINSCC
jgi:DNA gyrase subunit A